MYRDITIFTIIPTVGEQEATTSIRSLDFQQGAYRENFCLFRLHCPAECHDRKCKTLHVTLAADCLSSTLQMKCLNATTQGALLTLSLPTSV